MYAKPEVPADWMQLRGIFSRAIEVLHACNATDPGFKAKTTVQWLLGNSFCKTCLFKKNNRGTRRTRGRPPHAFRARTSTGHEARAVLTARNSAATPDERV